MSKSLHQPNIRLFHGATWTPWRCCSGSWTWTSWWRGTPTSSRHTSTREAWWSTLAPPRAPTAASRTTWTRASCWWTSTGSAWWCTCTSWSTARWRWTRSTSRRQRRCTPRLPRRDWVQDMPSFCFPFLLLLLIQSSLNTLFLPIVCSLTCSCAKKSFSAVYTLADQIMRAWC